MKLHHALDDIFSTWSHVAVLRELYDTGSGLTGREIARLSGMNHRACLNALSELEALSVVYRQRGGRDHFFSLNRKHRLVEAGILPILRLEREFPKALFHFLKKHVASKVVSAIIFGSVARKEETATSDLDICLVVNNNRKSSAQDAVHDIAASILSEYGARLSPLILSRREFVEKARKSLPPVKQMLEEGIVIAGSTMKELLNVKR